LIHHGIAARTPRLAVCSSISSSLVAIFNHSKRSRPYIGTLESML
jgi:hypothetical protein